MIIAQISDIHVRLYKRHNEYRQVFERLYKSLKEKKVDRIILTGDIVHNKTILSPECVQLVSELFDSLSKIAPVDVILGNHDINITNKQRLNALSPILDNLTTEKYPITLYEKSGFYDIDSKHIYGIFSILDEENFPKLINKEKDKKYIALFHGNLTGSSLENGYVFKDTNYHSSMFDNFDYVMMGDIHKRQCIANKCWYSGSLLQNTYAEELNKGYLLWYTEKSLHPEFIEIKNDYGYHVFEINKNNELTIFDSQVMSIKPSIRLIFTSDYTIAEIKKIEIDIREKYNPIYLEWRREETKQENSKKIQEKISDITSVDVQNKLIRDFFKSLEEDQILRILKINKETRLQIKDEDITKPSIWKIDNIKFSNVFSYGTDNSFDFNKLKGITGIFAPNRSGKCVQKNTKITIEYDKNEIIKLLGFLPKELE